MVTINVETGINSIKNGIELMICGHYTHLAEYYCRFDGQKSVHPGNEAAVSAVRSMAAGSFTFLAGMIAASAALIAEADFSYAEGWRRPMTKKAAFADLLREWDQLLDAANDNEEAMALAVSLRAEFAQTVERARELKARQESLAASRQVATQKLAETVEIAVDQARRLQMMAKALLGPSNERLVQFRVAPLRGRRKTSVRPVV